MVIFIFCLLSLLQCRFVFAQQTSFPHLPDPNTYPNGSFLIPNTGSNQVYDQGQTLNITWTTIYRQTNLFFLINNNFANPVQLASGTTETSYLWKVDDQGNNTHVFSFRIVDALGSANDQLNGGFYTGNFWIRDAALAAAAAGSTLTTTTTSSSVPTATTTSGSTLSTATATTSSSASVTSSSSAASTASSPTSTSSPTPAATSAAPSSNGTAIGAGVGVGAGVVVVLIAAGLFVWYHRKKRNESQQGALAPPQSQYLQAGPMPPAYPAIHEAPNAQYGVHKSPQEYYAPVEAPADFQPRELPADTSGAQYGYNR